MSTAILDTKRTTSIHVERTCACPFSIAEEYAVQYLKQAEAGGPEAVVRVPLPLLPTMSRKVSMSFGLAFDVSEAGRQHDEIRLHWNSGSPLFPNFRGTIRFRIDGTGSVIMIDGSYEAPFGRLGKWFDRIVGRRIAERTLADLARRISCDLEQKERGWRDAHEPPNV
jgi:hypothetical protein